MGLVFFFYKKGLDVGTKVKIKREGQEINDDFPSFSDLFLLAEAGKEIDRMVGTKGIIGNGFKDFGFCRFKVMEDLPLGVNLGFSR